MRDWKQIRVAAGIEVYFCDPHAPWQRGTNENTNRLLRQYVPKGTDFTTVTEAQLDAVADSPRRRSQTCVCNDRQDSRLVRSTNRVVRSRGVA